MRYLLPLFVLCLAGCGSTNWTGWQWGTRTLCDSTACSECPLEPADSVTLDPAPFMQRPMSEYPVIEGPAFEGTLETAPVPEPAAEPDSDFDVERIPVPTPDPAT